MFNGLRWILRTGSPWRLMPHDLPPWEAVYQQSQRWIKWGCLEAMVHDLRVLSREAVGKEAQPTAVIFDGRTIQSSSESGDRAGFDGNSVKTCFHLKRRKGSKVHLAVGTLGRLLALVITPANEQERAQVAELCQAVQEVTGQNVTVAFVDQGYNGEDAQAAALAQGITLEIAKHPAATKGFVVLPKRWIVERSIA